ncbi:ABC transporter permease [Henriciella sp.]|uniref:ABC transporter permease n=1 Tax=Henriciella sp. TaxID=1968823 RepID=UPI0025C2A2B7|nr:ABC transporter permease [Henriciella sp.]
MIDRDIRSRYQGALFGLFWTVLNPMFLLAMYTFVFTVIFRSRWVVPETDEAAAAATSGTFGFATLLFCGLILHAFLAEIISASPRLILQNKNYVKRVVFPLEILPMVITGTAVFHFLIKLVVLLGFVLVINHTLPITALLAPLVFLPLILMGVGLAWMFSALGVYLRDLNQIITPLLTGLLFLGPILYPAEAVPEQVRLLMHLNPLSVPVEEMRRVLIFGSLPYWTALLYYTAASLLVSALGYMWFNAAKRGFADVV